MIIQNDGGIFFKLWPYTYIENKGNIAMVFAHLPGENHKHPMGQLNQLTASPLSPFSMQKSKNQAEIWPGLTTYWKYINEYSIKWSLVINFCTLKLAPHASYFCRTQYLQASIIPSTMIPLWEPACTNLALGPRLHCLKAFVGLHIHTKLAQGSHGIKVTWISVLGTPTTLRES